MDHEKGRELLKKTQEASPPVQPEVEDGKLTTSPFTEAVSKITQKAVTPNRDVYQPPSLADYIKRTVEYITDPHAEGRIDVPLRALKCVEAALAVEGKWKQTFLTVKEKLTKGETILLYGPRWTGKTVLAMALWAEINRFCHRAVYVKQIELLRKMRLWFNNQDEGEYYSYTSRRNKILIIDEAGVKVRGDQLSESDSALLTTMIDDRYASELSTVFISNESLPEIINCLGPTIMRRIAECGTAIECNWGPFGK